MEFTAYFAVFWFIFHIRCLWNSLKNIVYLLSENQYV